MNAAEILRELVAIPTPSAQSNLHLLQWVIVFLKSRGWHSELFPYADENGTSKANLIARPATMPIDSSIDLAFVCHTDTVPYAAEWSDALELRSVDGLLHGCGACDVKGALACFLAAVDQLSSDTLTSHPALILTADEEIGCKGMDRLLAATQLQIKSAIVSEPTSLRPGIAGKGYGLARITIRGIEAHSAFPTEGVSAISLAARFITAIEALSSAPQEEDALFDPPHTTFNIGTIEGGSAKNIIAGHCTFLVEWRPIPADDPRNAFHDLKKLARTLESKHPHTSIQLELLRAEPGFAPKLTSKLQQRLLSAAQSTNQSPCTATGISFGSEASRLSRVCDDIIVIGPGDMHTAHSDRECVPNIELEQWTQTLRALMI